MYNGMIVTLSSFLNVTDLEVDSIHVRERRVPRSMRQQWVSKASSWREGSREDRSQWSHWWGWTTFYTIFSSWRYISQIHGREEEWSKSVKIITTSWTKIYQGGCQKNHLRRYVQEGKLWSFCILRHEVYPWKSKIKKEEGKYGGYIWGCHNLVEEVIVGAIKRYCY